MVGQLGLIRRLLVLLFNGEFVCLVLFRVWVGDFWSVLVCSVCSEFASFTTRQLFSAFALVEASFVSSEDR